MTLVCTIALKYGILINRVSKVEAMVLLILMSKLIMKQTSFV